MNTINKTFLVKLINLMKVNGYTSKAINTGLNKLSKKASVLNKLGWYIAADSLSAGSMRRLNPILHHLNRGQLVIQSSHSYPGVRCPVSIAPALARAG